VPALHYSATFPPQSAATKMGLNLFHVHTMNITFRGYIYTSTRCISTCFYKWDCSRLQGYFCLHIIVFADICSSAGLQLFKRRVLSFLCNFIVLLHQ